MDVSWNWLTDYVSVKAPVREAAERLTMAGVTVEDIEETAEDFVLDVEITSNRPDWLSHIGIAREIAALYGLTLRVPDVKLPPGSGAIGEEAALEVPDPDLCPLYTARVVKGVRIGPSPDWLKAKVESVGLRPVNNVVDITNYVLYECGQPLHAFDLHKLADRKVVVRRAVAGEHITLIDGTGHTLLDSDLVIADARDPVAVAGVMGGLESEIGDDTTDILIESALFDQYSVRATSKRLAVSTDASYRFERGVDLETVDWASRRTAQLILEIAGGTLCEGALIVGETEKPRGQVELRMSHLKRLLGHEVAIDEARAILASLGFVIRGGSPASTVVEVPSFRGDVREEADLVEEVARIHGYDRIPFETAMKISVGRPTGRERVSGAVEDILTSAGFHGCVSYSLVTGDLVKSHGGVFRQVSPWTDEAPICIQSREGHEDAFMRTSLIPSLLVVRKTNEDRKVPEPDVYEVAHVYLPSDAEVPRQPLTVAAVTGSDFGHLKGIAVRILETLGAGQALFEPAQYDFFTPGQSAKITLDGRLVGVIGRASDAVASAIDLSGDVTAFELDLSPYEDAPPSVAAFKPLQRFPGVERDIALVVDEAVTWAQIAACIEGAGAPELDTFSFTSVYRGAPVPAGKKSIALHVVYRSTERTLTGEQADVAQAKIVAALSKKHGAKLR